jgi:hypothetical protein
MQHEISADERIAELERDNAELRRALPVTSDDGTVKWPSIHDNAPALRSALIGAHREIENYVTWSNAIVEALNDAIVDKDEAQTTLILRSVSGLVSALELVESILQEPAADSAALIDQAERARRIANAALHGQRPDVESTDG